MFLIAAPAKVDLAHVWLMPELHYVTRDEPMG